MRTNALSSLGRMSWGTHFMFYPAFGVFAHLVVMPWWRARSEASNKAEWDDMVQKVPVDPDNFNPFTPIPYHNNPELKYAFAHVNMRNYVNENHINTNEFIWRNYHNSYDHSNKKTYMYNWTSV